MTNQSWIKSVLAHKAGERVPYNFMFSPPARARVEGRFGGPAEETLNLPMRMTSSVSIKPLYADPARFGPTIKDEFGVVWSTNLIDRGSPIGPCLAEPDLSGYTFPDPAASYRFEGLEQWCTVNRNHFTVIWVGDLWERATFMRDMQNILMDLVLNPGFVKDLLRKLADHILATMAILFERYSFDCIAVSDDYGAQQALVMSPALWREFIKPLLAEIYNLARQNGRKVFHHSCGNVREIAGDLIDIGLDILHPIQPETMDILALKREFGRDLTFCGGVSTQGLLVHGTPGEVRAEVRRLKEQMGVDGGYILEPGITLQDDVPLANMEAMIEESREL